LRDDQNRKNLERWRHARIDRFVRRQRQLREWINFGDVAEFCAREAGSIVPDEDKRALTYEELADALIKGEFDESERTRVLFLYPGSRRTRMTWEWLLDTINFNLDGERGRGLLAHCWAPREAMARFFEKRRLPLSPAVFGQPTSDREPPKRQGGAASSHHARRSPATRPSGKNERKRQAVDAAIGKFGVDALMVMPQKEREQRIKELAEPELGGLTVSERYVRQRLALAAERKER
jgi:hypothetical protein